MISGCAVAKRNSSDPTASRYGTQVSSKMISGSENKPTHGSDGTLTEFQDSS